MSSSTTVFCAVFGQNVELIARRPKQSFVFSPSTIRESRSRSIVFPRPLSYADQVRFVACGLPVRTKLPHKSCISCVSLTSLSLR